MATTNFVERANTILPGGTFGNFDSDIIIQKGNAARVWDTFGNEFIDFLIGSGPMILGHCNPEVVDAVHEQLSKGTTFFANNERGIELAEEISKAVPCAEKVRFTTTGSEADMYAIRLARAYTGRNKIIKFEGGYHGMSAEAQMSLAPKHLKNFPNATPDSSGIPSSVANEVLIAPFNDISYIRSLISEYAGEVACIMVEPIQRILPPVNGFLESLRKECTNHDILLIFDEIVTGFRLAYGGAQEYFGVVPDICTLGKIIGGGFPIAAVAGKTEIMDYFDENIVSSHKSLMQHGTLNGNPIAAVAGLKTLEILRRPSQYKKLELLGKQIMSLFVKNLKETEHNFKLVGCPVLFDIVFSKNPINNYREFIKSDLVKLKRFNYLLRQNRILKSLNKIYISLALTNNDIAETAQAIKNATQAINT